MPYVSRQDGAVVGIYAVLQPGHAEEWLPDNHQDVREAVNPPPTIDDYRISIQRCLDAKARERGYDNGHTIATYVTSAVPAWALEAQAFVAWRDTVWQFAFEELSKVETGGRVPPTPDDFCNELPAFTWPNQTDA